MVQNLLLVTKYIILYMKLSPVRQFDILIPYLKINIETSWPVQELDPAVNS